MVQRRLREPGGRQRLSALDWADAALTAIGEGGLAAVAVEPLAVRLGTTKGSFYWHFASREALIEAALLRWEETGTEAVITALSAEPDPEVRLRSLFTQATEAVTGSPLEVSLLATVGHPLVATVVRRVTERRLGYLTQLFSELGFNPEEARLRGTLGYTSFLGHGQLVNAVPEALPPGQERAHHLDSIIDMLLRRD
ncbi:TetR/AcrR family transcriptional regulator [Streptomyces syringium]|uniref:TetR/AcrR family transcriptional regulator n=1 Tax=Streptomyces syringium TaxID=76729 RepID=UPI0033E52E37